MSQLRSGPLTDLRVLEFAAQGPVPFAAMVLADLGADVVVVDRVTDPTYVTLPNPVIDRGRRSIAVDLKHPRAPEVILRLVAQADVLLDGLRPGAMERLHLGPTECLGRNPALVYSRLTGWGQTGPLAQTAGHDINYIALSGALNSIGRYGQPPTVPMNLVGDYAGGSLFHLVGVLASVMHARATGEGQVVDTAMLDGAAALMSMAQGRRARGEWRDERGTNLADGGAPFYDVYECADGRYVAVGAVEDRFYDALLSGLGLNDDSLRAGRLEPRRWPAIRAVLSATFLTRSRDEWAKVFSGTDACVTPVLSMTEAPLHPANRARSVFQHRGDVVVPSPTPRFGATPSTSRAELPARGEDSDAILSGCGWSPDEIAALHQQGVVK